MKETRCPFLETKTVVFCKAFPSKMIPVDRMSSTGGLCNTCHYEECPLYGEIGGAVKGRENVRGFHLESEYYYHPEAPVGRPVRRGRGRGPGGDRRFRGPSDRQGGPRLGARRRRGGEGEPRLLPPPFRSRTVHLVAPANGVIKGGQPRVAADPSILNDDPYSEGWIFSMRLKKDAVKGLYHETVARKWYESEVERLQRVFSSDLGMLATDGGEALTDISGRLNDVQWGKIVSQFLG